MLHQRGGFNSSYMTKGWMLRVRDLKVSCYVSNLLIWHFHPNRIRHMIILPVDIHSLWPSEKSTDWLQVFEKGMLRNTFRSVWAQAVEENISKCSRTSYWPGYLEVSENSWAGHFEVFKKGAAGVTILRCSRTACWGEHLEVFDSRLLRRIFCPYYLFPSWNILPVHLMMLERSKQNSWDKEELHKTYI